jgi:tungstate transport system permease protein
MEIIFLSLKVSLTALLIGTAAGVPVGALVSLKKIPLKHVVLNIMNTSMGIPPVVAGLFLYLMLSRSGPLGSLGLLYTPSAMVIAQSILAFPIVASLSYAAINGVPGIIRQAATTLGATRLQCTIAVIRRHAMESSRQWRRPLGA